MLLLSASFFRPARDKCTYSINKATDLKCSPALKKKKKKRNVRFWVGFPSIARTLNLFRFQMKRCCYFSAVSPWAQPWPFHCWMEITDFHTSASLCLCKVTPRLHEVHVIYLLQLLRLFLHVYRGQILIIEIHSECSARGIQTQSPCFSSLVEVLIQTQKLNFVSLSPSLMQ